MDTRNLLTYSRLVILEVQWHSGSGWLQYDRIFRQHPAISPSTVWHELNPSLHRLTVLSYHADPSRVCSICHEPDNTAETSAMRVLQSTSLATSSPQSSLLQPQPPSRTGPRTSGVGPVASMS